MRVFIENERGSTTKNLFNEKTLEFRKSVTVSRPYPFPYGFVLETTSGDGDNFDCFVLTDQHLTKSMIVDVEPIGMFEQIEDGKEDPKILAAMPGESPTISEETRSLMKEFCEHVFDHLPGRNLIVGRFLDAKSAQALLEKSRDQIKEQ